MGVPPVQIHVMSAISGVEWDEVWSDRVERAGFDELGFELVVRAHADAEGFADSRLKDVDRQGLEAVRHLRILWRLSAGPQGPSRSRFSLHLPALSRRSTDMKLKTRPCGAVVVGERREPGPAILDA